MKLLAIAGRKGAGKDTFAQPLIDSGRWALVKFADPLKNMLRSLFRDAGVDPQTTERMIEGDLKETPTPVLCGKTPRFAMQTLGTEWRDMIGQGLWLNITKMRIAAYARGGQPAVVITDMRFPHEVAFVEQAGGTSVRVVGTTPPNDASDHPSEKAIDSLPVAAEVFNFGSVDQLHTVAEGVASAVQNSNVKG